MRHLAGAINRAWLAVLGIILVLVSATWILTSTGALTTLIPGWPESSSTFDGAAEILQIAWLPAVVLICGVILAVLGVLWIVAQVPRKRQAKPYRLQTDAAHGLTLMTASTIAQAVADDAEVVTGVEQATVIVRGSATAPELLIRADIDERTDIAEAVNEIGARVAGNCAQAIEATLVLLAIEVNIVRGKKKATAIVVE